MTRKLVPLFVVKDPFPAFMVVGVKTIHPQLTVFVEDLGFACAKPIFVKTGALNLAVREIGSPFACAGIVKISTFHLKDAVLVILFPSHQLVLSVVIVYLGGFSVVEGADHLFRQVFVAA